MQPNFLVVLVDDMGYSDPGCYGGEIQTPNLDRLANNGVRFSQFYNCSRCCPTRASMLTGAYPHRIGMKEFGRTMDTSVPTVAGNLQSNGYSTAMVGKWHLTELPQEPRGTKRIQWMNHELKLDAPFGELASYPTRRGFEQFYGIIWGVVDHFDPFSLMEGEVPVEKVSNDFYFTDAISSRAVQYLKDFKNKGKPFFLYVAYSAPHWPIQAREEDISKYRERYSQGWNALREERFKKQQAQGIVKGNALQGKLSARDGEWGNLSRKEQDYFAEKMAVHAAMVDRVDQGLGDIIDSLEANGQLDNTVIFFMSDNGASPEIPEGAGYDRHGGTRDGRAALREHELMQEANLEKLGSNESYTGIGAAWASASNTPHRLWKMESYDGGCRTPLVVHWPAGLKTKNGSWINKIGHVVDIAPTCYDLAAIEPDAETLKDGVSLVSLFQSKELAEQDRLLFFEHGAGKGVRSQVWKASKRQGHPWQLFRIEQDPGETTDVAEQHPLVLERLTRAWQTWSEEVGS